MTTLICICVVALLALQVASWANNWRNRWKYRHIPGPRPSLVLGNAPTIRRKKSFIAFSEWQAIYGDVFKVFFVRQPAVVVSDPVLARQVTIKDFSKFHDRLSARASNALSPQLFSGNRLKATLSSMILARGSAWGSLRAAVQPMFHSSHLQEYGDTINTAVDALIVNLDQLAGTGKQTDIYRHLGRLTMQVIGAAAFGVDFDTQRSSTGTDIPLIEAAKSFFASAGPSTWAVFSLLMPRSLLPVIKIVAQAFPDKSMQRVAAASNTVYDACNNLIENSRKVYNGQSPKPKDWTWFKGDPNSPYKDMVPAEKSVISMLQQANNKATGTAFEPVEIAAQANVMILAGYETTANTLAYCIYFISKTPHCQQQLLDEIDQFKGCPGYGDLAAFPYVRAVVNEALRLYPPGPQLSRTAMEDVQLGPYFIPKETLIQINLWGMHHDERWWEEAQQFKPERWLNDKTGGDRSGGLAYMPFGLGPHNCVGMKLALEEAIIALVRLYQRYIFVLDDKLLTGPIELRQGITVSPKEVPVTVKLRCIAPEA